jgi:hypothetical protein
VNRDDDLTALQIGGAEILARERFIDVRHVGSSF